MPLQTSGAISMANIRTELGRTGVISLNDATVRTLLQRTTAGSSISLSHAYGKSSVVKLATPVVTSTAGAGAVVFSWTAVTNATSYDVSFNGATAVNQTTTTLTKTGLANATSYSVSVVAKGGTGYSNSDPGTDSETTWPKLVAPTISTTGHNQSVSYTVKNNDTVTRDVSRRTRVGLNGTWSSWTAVSLAAGATSTPASVGCSYSETVYIEARVTAASHADSDTASVGQMSFSRLSAPSISNSSSTANSITFRVTNPNSVTVAASVQLEGGGMGYVQSYNIEGSGNADFTFSSLSASTAYTPKATLSANGFSASSTTIGNNISTTVAAPGAVGTPTASDIGPNSMTLSWTGGSGATSFDIFRWSSGWVWHASSTSSPKEVTGLTAATSYYFYVRASNASGSASSTFNDPPFTTLAVPSAVTISSVSPSGMTLKWAWADGTIAGTSWEYYITDAAGSVVKSATIVSSRAGEYTASSYGVNFTIHVRARITARSVSAYSSLTSALAQLTLATPAISTTAGDRQVFYSVKNEASVVATIYYRTRVGLNGTWSNWVSVSLSAGASTSSTSVACAPSQAVYVEAYASKPNYTTSGTASASQLSFSQLGAPSISNSSSTANSITFRVTNPNSVTVAASVQLEGGGVGYGQSSNIAGSSNANFTFSSLSAGTTYTPKATLSANGFSASSTTTGNNISTTAAATFVGTALARNTGASATVSTKGGYSQIYTFLAVGTTTTVTSTNADFYFDPIICFSSVAPAVDGQALESPQTRDVGYIGEDETLTATTVVGTRYYIQLKGYGSSLGAATIKWN